MGRCCRRGEHGALRRRSQTLPQAMRRNCRTAANGSPFPLTPLPHSARPMPFSLRHPGRRSRRFMDERRSPRRKSRSRPLLICRLPRVSAPGADSDSAGQEQTPPQPGQVFSHDHASSQSQRQNIAPRSEGDDFDPSETPRKPNLSPIQDELAQRHLANQLIAQDRSTRSSENTRAAAPNMPRSISTTHSSALPRRRRCKRLHAYNPCLHSRRALSILTRQCVLVQHRKHACQNLPRSIGNPNRSKTSQDRLRRNRIVLSGQAR